MNKIRWKQFSFLFIASGGFVGYFPWAPGTIGSLIGVGILLVIPATLGVQAAMTATLVFVGLWAAHRAHSHFKVVDSPKIVIDEIAGMMVTMLGMPLTTYWFLWGFVFFRTFDILKPPPAKFFDTRVKNAWGVMLDDIVAGIYGNILLHLMRRGTL